MQTPTLSVYFSQVDAKHFLIQTEDNKDDFDGKIVGTCVDRLDQLACDDKCHKEGEERYDHVTTTSM